MTIRRPLVRIAGQVVQLPAADTLAGTPAPVLAISATTRTLGLADAGAYLRCTGASTVISIPAQASVAWVADTEVTIRHAGTGNLTLTPASGVSLGAPSGGTLVMTVAMTVTLKRVATDVWDVIGQTVAS